MVKKSLCALLVLSVACAGSVFAQEFVDVSVKAGVADDGLGKGAAFADVNGDGLVDLYVSNKGGANKLFLNKGDGTFKDATATAGKGVDFLTTMLLGLSQLAVDCPQIIELDLNPVMASHEGCWCVDARMMLAQA